MYDYHTDRVLAYSAWRVSAGSDAGDVLMPFIAFDARVLTSCVSRLNVRGLRRIREGLVLTIDVRIVGRFK